MLKGYKISYQNYDYGFKESFTVFHNKVLDFLKLKIPKIKAYLPTEFKQIQTKTTEMDLNFTLEDGSILHLEEEIGLSRDDIIRFAEYDLKLYNTYNTNIKTVVLCMNEVKEEHTKIELENLNYKVQVIKMNDFDGEATLKKIKEKLKNGEEINELELIFLPLMKSNISKIEMLKESVEIEKKLNKKEKEIKDLIALTLVMCDKIVDRKQLENIWEEIKMYNFIEFAIEKGREEGIELGREKGIELGREEGIELGREKGIELGREEGIAKTIIRILTRKFGLIPKEIKDKILKSDEYVLEIIADNVVDFNKIDDIKKYLGE